jgi:DNA primase
LSQIFTIFVTIIILHKVRFMINYDLLSLVEKVLGKGRRTSGNNYSFFSPFISHYKPKLEIDLTVNNNRENPWHCWVSNAKGRSIISLFKKVKAGKQYLDDLNKILKTKNLYIQNNKETKEELVLPKEFISLYKFPTIKDIQIKMQIKQALNYLKSRGIGRTDILRYGIGYCPNGNYSGRIVVPSYDDNFNLNFFVSRSIFEEDTLKYKNPKWSKDVIGFESFINWEEPITLVEGVFDAITARYNTIPLFGKIIQPKLMEKILLRKPPKVIVALDNDAVNDSIKISSKLLCEGIEVSMVKMEQKDINEMGFKNFVGIKNETKTTDSYDIIKQRIIYA